MHRYTRISKIKQFRHIAAGYETNHYQSTHSTSTSTKWGLQNNKL